MSNTRSLSEIVYTACNLPTKQEKIDWLRENNSLALRDILKIMYDKNIKLLIPNTAPPYSPSDMPDSHGMLYRETRLLKHFVEGYSGNLSNAKRESLFIQMLETVDKGDAKLLVDMISQKPLKGLTALTINKAFGFELIPTDKKDKKN